MTLSVLIINFLVARFITFPDEINFAMQQIATEIQTLKINGQFGDALISIFKTIIMFITSSFSGLAMLFTSLIIGKTIIKKKKFSSLWFLIYILLTYLITKITELIFPSLSYFEPTGYPDFSSFSNSAILVNILITIILVTVSSILLEKKIEI